MPPALQYLIRFADEFQEDSGRLRRRERIWSTRHSSVARKRSLAELASHSCAGGYFAVHSDGATLVGT